MTTTALTRSKARHLFFGSRNGVRGIIALAVLFYSFLFATAQPLVTPDLIL